MATRTLKISPSSAQFKHVFNTRKQRSNSGYLTAQDFGGGYWEISLAIPSSWREKYSNLFAFLNEHKNSEAFELLISKFKDSRSNYRGSIISTAGDSVGASTLSITASANTTILKAGDFIKADNSQKIYQVTRDCSTSAIGTGTIYITPSLISSIATSEEIIYRNVPFTVMAETENTLNVDVNLRGNIDLSFVEAFTS